MSYAYLLEFYTIFYFTYAHVKLKIVQVILVIMLSLVYLVSRTLICTTSVISLYKRRKASRVANTWLRAKLHLIEGK